MPAGDYLARWATSQNVANGTHFTPYVVMNLAIRESGMPLFEELPALPRFGERPIHWTSQSEAGKEVDGAYDALDGRP